MELCTGGSLVWFKRGKRQLQIKLELISISGRIKQGD
jgi:hypothetical protein